MLAWVWILVLLKRYKWPLLLVFYFPLIFKHCIIRLIDNWAIDLDKVAVTWFITGFDSFGHFASVVFRLPFIWFRRWWNWLQAVINCANHDGFWNPVLPLFQPFIKVPFIFNYILLFVDQCRLFIPTKTSSAPFMQETFITIKVL